MLGSVWQKVAASVECSGTYSVSCGRRVQHLISMTRTGVAISIAMSWLMLSGNTPSSTNNIDVRSCEQSCTAPDRVTS